MRTLLLLLCAAALHAGAPANSIQVQAVGGAAQTNVPVTLFRRAPAGMYGRFVKPMVNGKEPVYWQFDEHSRWTDQPGVAYTIASCSATTPAECQLAMRKDMGYINNFPSGSLVRITGASNPALNHGGQPLRVVWLDANRYLFLDPATNLPVGGANSGGTMMAYGKGSVQWFQSSFVIPSLPAPVVLTTSASLACASYNCTVTLPGGVTTAGLAQRDAVELSGAAEGNLNAVHIVDKVLSENSFRVSTFNVSGTRFQRITIKIYPQTKVDFVDSATASSGQPALTDAEILALGGSDWDARIIATPPPGAGLKTVTTSARAMLQGGFCRRHWSGPAVVKLVCEDKTRGRSFDFGWWSPTAMALVTAINPMTDEITTATPVPQRWVHVSSSRNVLPKNVSGYIGGGTRFYRAYMACPTQSNSFKLASDANCTSFVDLTETYSAAAFGRLTVRIGGIPGAQDMGVHDGPVPGAASYLNDGTFQQAHPQFGLEVWCTQPGVLVDFRLQHPWITERADLPVQLELRGRWNGVDKTLYKTANWAVIQDAAFGGGFATLTLAPGTDMADYAVGQAYQIRGSQGNPKLIGNWRVSGVNAATRTVRIETQGQDFVRNGTYTANSASLVPVLYADTGFWEKRWVGTAPETVRVDHNLEWLVYSKTLPPLRTATERLAWRQRYVGNRNYTRAGVWNTSWISRKWPETGQRDDIGVIDKDSGEWLGSMATEAFEHMQAVVLQFAGMPYHWRESTPDKNRYRLDLNGNGSSDGDVGDAASGDSFGEYVSLAARPGGVFAEPGTADLAYDPSERDIHMMQGELGAAWTQTISGYREMYKHGFTKLDVAHAPASLEVYVRVTGDPFAQEEARALANALVLLRGAALDNMDARHGSWGLASGQPREYAWRVRSNATACGPATKDSDVANKLQMCGALARVGAQFEGIHDVRDGGWYQPTQGGWNQADPCKGWQARAYSGTNTPWTHGHCMWQNVGNFGGFQSVQRPNPLSVPIWTGGAACGGQPVDTSEAPFRTLGCTQEFQQSFVISSMARAADEMPELTRIARKIAEWKVTLLSHPDMNRWAGAMYSGPGVQRPATGKIAYLAQTPQQYMAGYKAEIQALTNWREWECDRYNYPLHAIQAVTWFPDLVVGPASAEAAFAFGKANLMDRNPEQYDNNSSPGCGWISGGAVVGVHHDGYWNMRYEPTRVQVTSGKSGMAQVEYLAQDITACTVTIGGAAATVDATRGRQQVASRLMDPGTHPVVIHCAKDPFNRGLTNVSVVVTP